MSLTIEQLKFAREIGATHYWHGKFWKSGTYNCAAFFDDNDPQFWNNNEDLSDPNGKSGMSIWEGDKIDFTPLDDYYADKAVDIAATGGELEYDPADVAFKRPAPDMVNNPPHYQTDRIECIEAIRASLGLDGFVAYCRGNAIKYSWRAGKKGAAAQDLRKAAWYLNRAADELTKGENE